MAGFASGQELYEKTCCGRGDMENRIKEQQLGLFADRALTTPMASNPLRLSDCATTGVERPVTSEGSAKMKQSKQPDA